MIGESYLRVSVARVKTHEAACIQLDEEVAETAVGPERKRPRFRIENELVSQGVTELSFARMRTDALENSKDEKFAQLDRIVTHVRRSSAPYL